MYENLVLRDYYSAQALTVINSIFMTNQVAQLMQVVIEL